MKYYENAIHHAVFDTNDPNVVRHHKWSFAVGCLVSNSESASAHFEHNIDEHNETYTAHHAIGIDFYKDPNFLHQYTNEPVRLTIGEKVYVKVYVEKPDWNSKMRLHTCYTKPPGTQSTNLEHVLIRDGLVLCIHYYYKLFTNHSYFDTALWSDLRVNLILKVRVYIKSY